MNQSRKVTDSPSSRSLANAVVKRGLFTAPESEQLRSLALSWSDARLSGTDADTDAAPETKVATRRLIPLNDEYRWIYERLGGFARATGALGFEFEKIHVPLKTQRYETGGFHCWHNDIASPRYRTRKLGITLQLSPTEA